MKSKWYVVVALLLLAQVSQAQLSLGLKAGANLTKIDGKAFNEEFKWGYLVGGFARLKLGEKLGIQPEVLFLQSKLKTDTAFTSVYQNAATDARNKDINLNYLAIPVLLDYKIGGDFLSLQAGPQFGILLDQNKDLVNNGQEAFKTGDFSLLGGAQIKISRIVASARYVIGLNDKRDLNYNTVSDKTKWKSQGLQLAVGLNF
ncbi:porin family protein [Paraflavisolibacter sp. H34]|uniref:porin family protein n=1 Tax=Huijunlia imazamoxiresistens TaxID=3127457 RepID=UPI0030194255